MVARLATSLFRLLLDAAPDATVIVDENATIVLANAQITNVLGWSHDELVGQHIEVLVPTRLRGIHRVRRAGFLRAPEVRPMGVGRNLFAQHRDGHELPVEISLSPLETDSGVLVSASVRDISDRLRIEEETTRMREEMIATVSHELRTPLTSIIGYAELLEDLDDTELGPQARGILEIIQRNAARELRLVDDLLTMASLDDERLQITRAPVDLLEVVQRVVVDHEPSAQEAQIEVRIEGESLRPVYGDFIRLVQVVENLLTNALKFTGPGGAVTIRLSDGGTMAVVEVADTGAGVTPEEASKLFQRLYRGSDAVASQTQGAGLGLPIAQKIVDAHGGSIDVTSELGVGTVFRVHLPYATSRPFDTLA
ncbi:MAG: ATP-binding protein [Nocardioides sp.]|nr:ATP-binding protein [Nocardioides sp.]